MGRVPAATRPPGFQSCWQPHCSRLQTDLRLTLSAVRMISERLRSSTTVQCLKRRRSHRSVMCTSAVKGTLTHPAHVWMLPSAKFPWGRSGWTSSPCYWLAVVGMQWNSKWWETQWDICGGIVLSCSFIALLGLKPKQGCISKFVLMETLNKTSYTAKNGERNVRIATKLATLALIVGQKHHIGVEAKSLS